MIHKIPGKPGILELAQLVETKILAQLAEDTEAGSLHLSLSQLPAQQEDGLQRTCGDQGGSEQSEPRNSCSPRGCGGWGGGERPALCSEGPAHGDDAVGGGEVNRSASAGFRAPILSFTEAEHGESS